MRSPLAEIRHLRRALAPTLLLFLAAGCTPSDVGEREAVPGRDDAQKSVPVVRAARRAYDGAPPTIPHQAFGADCPTCHTRVGVAVEGVGFAPPSPHDDTLGLEGTRRCRQCHVPVTTNEVFVESTFVGRPQTLDGGARMHRFAPPVMPHSAFMRENCLACHDGPAAREGIRTSHPERAACRQCHVERVATTLWPPAG